MGIFYISDPHFGHANIIGSCGRPFESLQQMDETLIERWNAKVGNNDHVYIGGDFAHRSAKSMELLDPFVLEQMLGVEGCDKEMIRTVSQHAIHYDGELPVNATSPDGRYVIVACLFILDTLMGKVYPTKADFGLVLEGDQYIKDVRWDDVSLYYDVFTVFKNKVESFRFDLDGAEHKVSVEHVRSV